MIDVVNRFDHDDAESLLASFRERADAMEAPIAAARERGDPVVYVNDHDGSWVSNAPGSCAQRSTAAAATSSRGLRPDPDDPFLLKARYSVFDHTSLDLLLGELDVDRVLLMGAATEGCVVQSGIDAREHGLKVTILAQRVRHRRRAARGHRAPLRRGGRRHAGRAGLGQNPLRAILNREQEESPVLIATKDRILPTTVTGSWPRPSWFTGNLHERPFSSAMADVTYREQFVDAVRSVLNDQELAGLDILTNGDYHLDNDLGGRSWFSLPVRALHGHVRVRHRVDASAGATRSARG